MSFKKTIGIILLGMSLALGSVVADAKSRVSSKPSSYSSRSYSKPAVVSKPYTAPKTVYSTTTPKAVTRSAPARTTVIQKNYYGGSNGYNRGYSGGGSYGGGNGGGSGLGTSIVGGAVGAVGGMMLMDALTEDEGEKALKLQEQERLVEEAKAQQERDDKQDQILENQEEEPVQQVIPEPSDSFFKVNPQQLLPN